MITLLIWVLMLCLVMGVIIWAIQQMPIPAPFGTIAIVIVALIFILILASLLMGEMPLRPVLR